MNEQVAVLGAGVGGLTAAHELIERGFRVSVYERRRDIVGGKARSFGFGEVTGGRPPLPAEHGFRFFPGFYRHLPDTMRRIPYPGCANGVLDNLVPATALLINFAGETHTLRLPFVPSSPEQFREWLGTVEHMRRHFPPADLDQWAKVVWRLLSSCEERRAEDFEAVPWWKFIDAENRSGNYKSVVGKITRALVAADPKKGSTRTLGDIFLQMVFDLAGLGNPPDRILNGPTNEVWLDPWRAYLVDQGVEFHPPAEVTELRVRDGLIDDVVMTTGGPGGPSQRVKADYYVAAIGVESMAPLVTSALKSADPALEGIETLFRKHTEWMNGIQFYLSQPPRLTEPIHGHQMHLESPWALTSLSSDKFWKRRKLPDYGDGKFNTLISVDISDWGEPGSMGRTARQCTKQEIADEVWRQLRDSLPAIGRQMLVADTPPFHLDPAIKFGPGANGIPIGNDEPLLVNEVGTWALRPEARTRIPNLMLASDYVRTFTDLATMESANEAARRAVNAIIDESGTAVPFCAVLPQYEPLALKPVRWLDRWRYLGDSPWDKSTPVVVRTAQAMTSAALRPQADPPRPARKRRPRRLHADAVPDDVQHMLGDLLFERLRPAVVGRDLDALRRLFARDAPLWLDGRSVRIEEALDRAQQGVPPGFPAHFEILDAERIEVGPSEVRAVFIVEIAWGARETSTGQLHLTVEWPPTTPGPAPRDGAVGLIRQLGWAPFPRRGEEH